MKVLAMFVYTVATLLKLYLTVTEINIKKFEIDSRFLIATLLMDKIVLV